MPRCLNYETFRDAFSALRPNQFNVANENDRTGAAIVGNWTAWRSSSVVAKVSSISLRSLHTVTPTDLLKTL